MKLVANLTAFYKESRLCRIHNQLRTYSQVLGWKLIDELIIVHLAFHYIYQCHTEKIVGADSKLTRT